MIKRFFPPLCALLLGSICALAQSFSIAVIPKGTTHEFWKSVHAGTVKAQQEFEAGGGKLELIWKGPLKEDDREQQIQVVENFLGRKVSGIVLAPLDARALVAPVESAEAQKVPVVIIDSPLESPIPVSTVATDNFSGGGKGAEYLASLLGGKGRVAVLRYQEGSASTEAREKGFLDAIKEKYPGIEIVSADLRAGPTRDTAFRAAQNLLNRYGQKLDGVFCPNESSTAGMLLALKDAGLAGGKVKFVGFDSATALVEALEAGDLQGLVVQDPFQMGYLGVTTMLAHLQGKPVEKSTPTAVALVTKENFNDPATKDLLHPPLEKYLKP